MFIFVLKKLHLKGTYYKIFFLNFQYFVFVIIINLIISIFNIVIIFKEQN